MEYTPSDPLIGSKVAQYAIVAKLGGGGMGVVYKATDTKLGRTVALKFLPPQWSHDESAKQRFLREAQAASATNHPNICVIHDIEQTDDGRLFIVMAYYEGQTLKQKLEGGAIPLYDALDIAYGVALGLAKAHAQGVVHRDIKPGNLIVSDDGVKIVDFGLATFADAVRLTIEGSTIGTVAYMSPEQARGDEADARSDIWALGVVLFEMLAGELPFKGTYPEAVFYAIKNEPVPAPRVAAGEISGPLEALVLRTLEKDPDKRYQSARELARDLRLLQGLTVPVDLQGSPFPQPTPLTWWGRTRRAITPMRAAAALAVLVVAGAASFWWGTRPVVRIPVAIAPIANHTGRPELDAYRLALTESLISELLESPNIRVVPYSRLFEIVRPFALGGGDVSSSEAIQAIATRSGARFVVLPSLEYRSADGSWLAQAQVRSVETGTTGSTYESEGVTSSLPKDAVYRLMTSLADGLQQHFKTNGPGRSYLRRPAGSRFRNIEAARAFEEGLSAYGQLEYATASSAFRRATEQDEQQPMAHAWLSRVLLILHRDNEAGESAQRAKQLVVRETPGSDVTMIDGIMAETRKDFAAAEAQYRQLVRLQPDDPATQIELADFLKRQGRNQESVEAYFAVVRGDPGYVRPYVDLCQLYSRLNDQPLAERQAQTALDRYRAAVDGGGEAQALLCLGDVQREQGGARLTDARRNIEAARDIFQKLGQMYGLARVYQYLGTMAVAERNYPAAVPLFEQAVSRNRQVGNRELEGVGLMNLGVVHFELARVSQALGYFKQSRDVYEEIGDERRAAEQAVNAASLQITYGGDRDQTLGELSNARAALHRLGYIRFEVLAMQVQGEAQIWAGRIAEGRRQLTEALSIATEKRISDRIPSLKVNLAESFLLTNEYETARTQLEELVAADEGQEARIILGRTYLRLGDLGAASTVLQKALADAALTGQTRHAPLAYESLGELAYESRKVDEARRHFAKAAAFWTDDLPHPASVEARSYLGLIDALDRKDPTGKKSVQDSLRQTVHAGRLESEVLCRVHLARIELREQRYDAALAALNGVTLAADRVVGPELEAQLHFWRSQALGKHREAAGASDAARAQKLIAELQASLPVPYRDRFAARIDIRPMLQ